MAAADSSAMPWTESALSATWRTLALNSVTVDAVVLDTSWRVAALAATCSIEAPIWSTDAPALVTLAARRSTSLLMLRIEELMCAINEAVSSTASSICAAVSAAACVVSCSWLECSAALACAVASALTAASRSRASAASAAACRAAEAARARRQRTSTSELAPRPSAPARTAASGPSNIVAIRALAKTATAVASADSVDPSAEVSSGIRWVPRSGPIGLGERPLEADPRATARGWRHPYVMRCPPVATTSARKIANEPSLIAARARARRRR